jgi:hypothetical protein
MDPPDTLSPLTRLQLVKVTIILHIFKSVLLISHTVSCKNTQLLANTYVLLAQYLV